jgi:hypothetical protein
MSKETSGKGKAGKSWECQAEVVEEGAEAGAESDLIKAKTSLLNNYSCSTFGNTAYYHCG